MGQLLYDGETGEVTLARLRPFQLSNVDLPAFQEGRSFFTTEEWQKVLISSIGLNPEAYSAKVNVASHLADGALGGEEHPYVGAGSTGDWKDLLVRQNLSLLARHLRQRGQPGGAVLQSP
jgi:hypothetical protein